MFGTVADGNTINVHPVVWGCWFGMFATALNLLPFGQLDGGHIVYARFGRWIDADLDRDRRTAVAMTFLVDQLARDDHHAAGDVALFGPRHPGSSTNTSRSAGPARSSP